MYINNHTYGIYSEMQWKTLNGLKCVENELRMIAELCSPEYEAYAVGAILDDRDTKDLDIILLGPNRPERINFLLEEIVGIGFNNNVLIDVKWSVSNELFIPSQYNISMGKVSYSWALYQPEMIWQGKHWHNGAKLQDGLWIKEMALPLTKGYSFNDPVKLFA
tara:strand:- start:4810 stop:5298 length:489 start_codon:yes stop_codon:yes gene_type:complete